MRHISESISKVDEARNHKQSAIIDSIIDCLEKNSVIEDICDAADRGVIDIRSFTDEYGEEILSRINSSLIEYWNENY